MAAEEPPPDIVSAFASFLAMENVGTGTFRGESSARIASLTPRKGIPYPITRRMMGEIIEAKGPRARRKVGARVLSLWRKTTEDESRDPPIVSALTAFLTGAGVRTTDFKTHVALFSRRKRKTPVIPRFPISRLDVLGNTEFYNALKWYTERGYLGGVRRVIQLDKHVNLYYALWEAASNGRLEIVQYLLEAGGAQADIHAWHGGAKIEVNIHSGDDVTLRTAAEKGHLPVVQYLLEKAGEQANIHAVDDEALRDAAAKGFLELVRYLLDEREGEKANIHAGNDHALRAAVFGGHLPVVRYLLDERKGEKANIHAWNDAALRGAAETDNSEVVQYLISKGANAEVLTPEERERYGV